MEHRAAARAQVNHPAGEPPPFQGSRHCVGIIPTTRREPVDPPARAGRAMFLGLRELAFASGRFTLMGVVVALISLLMVLLSGLSTGLVNDGVSGLMRLPVTSFAFDEGTELDSAFSRSTVTAEQ